MNKEIELIEKVSEALSGTAQNVITHYSEWYFANAVSGVLLGAILIVAPLITMFKRPYFNSDFSVLLDILLCIVSMVGLFILFHNSATLFFPEGRAINQFIKDVRG